MVKIIIAMSILCVLALAVIEPISTAEEIPVQVDEPQTYPTTTDEQVAMLTKRMNDLEVRRARDLEELELKRARDVNELTRQVQELSKLHDNDMHEAKKLKQEVKELRMIYVKEINILTKHIKELESRYEKTEQIDVLLNAKIPHSLDNKTMPHDANMISQGSQVQKTMSKKHAVSTKSRSSSPKPSTRATGIHFGHLNTRVTLDEDIVAFHAILNKEISNPSTNHVVIYDHLILNSGGVHYSTNTGVFTCPQTGIYVFSWTVFVRNHQYIYTDLVRNNGVIGSGLATDDHDNYTTGSATAATHLEVGDEVWVRVSGHEDGSDLLPNLTMFTGFRLR
ncbi:uncharacterized protein [Argopecten irradians]|uniref:uncharacterized protein n=1 Tax=Argopecten irradians TaxID=31199 RepID=UPI00372429A7